MDIIEFFLTYDPTALSSLLSQDCRMQYFGGIMRSTALRAVEGFAMSFEEIRTKIIASGTLLQDVVMIDMSHSFLRNEDLPGIGAVVHAVRAKVAHQLFLNLSDNDFTAAFDHDALRSIMQCVRAVNLSLSLEDFAEAAVGEFGPVVMTDTDEFKKIVGRVFHPPTHLCRDEGSDRNRDISCGER
eukprot:m.249682 g.249682  ORF g.249682 m.249682 type:complete len:185 (-) comp16257_c0_seq1:277-831(-)